MKINALQERAHIKAPYLISNIVNGVSNSGQPYLSMTLIDNTGSIEGKIWDVKSDLVEKLKQGFIVEVEADVIKYKNSLQFKIQAVEILNQKHYNLSEFIKTSAIPKEELMRQINEVIVGIKNENLSQLIKKVFEEVGSSFYVYPAASKNHHEYVGGLATHTLEMIQVAQGLLKLYPNLNSDLLLSGILVHDLSKVNEYQSPIVAEYSVEGKLLGHISMAQAKVFQVASELKIEKCEEVTLLRHMILSHHGQYEFGSPVLPLIPEAELLNIIDNISARMNMFNKALENTEIGGFSTRVFPLENRSLYKSKFDKE